MCVNVYKRACVCVHEISSFVIYVCAITFILLLLLRNAYIVNIKKMYLIIKTEKRNTETKCCFMIIP